ncbi:hypothetical protein RFM68_19410 [Mesorhizobium sp. MSK_1335]|uniref:Uncharacterized protein n=1 Tax=Mesorhizobium montanum TaxID=3072323 RepID=A0ABU4ZMV7_9HYPH|nr:hypothetical protein [Mesorhizobium sp. MSK_1335]MDX8526670.1 hypothetical protein [Mesorhizobium sp. MSK_1335]
MAIQNTVPIWNDFFFPLVLITSDNLKTLPQGLTVFVGEFTTDWGAVHRADTGGAADYAALHRAVEAVHFRHHPRSGQIGGPSTRRGQTAKSGHQKWRTRTRSSSPAP